MEYNNRYVIAFLYICACVMVMLMIFSVFIAVCSSLIDGIKMLKHEGFSLGNSLSLLLGIFIILFFIFNGWIVSSFQSTDSPTLNSIITVILLIFDLASAYFLILYFNFTFASFFYSIYHPIRPFHYIIILGSGLIDGEKVSHLLAGRIEAGIKVYKRQNKRKKHPVIPKIIFSGGKGKDEAISEAQAMKQYALDHGVKEEDTILEDQSINTYQNMLNSKKIIESKEENIKKCRVLFCTTNYHVFRSAVYARQVGLQAQGIGASTKGYFKHNATLREFIAILKMHLKSCLITMFLFIFLCFMIPVVFNYLSVHSEEVRSLLQTIISYFH